MIWPTLSYDLLAYLKPKIFLTPHISRRRTLPLAYLRYTPNDNVLHLRLQGVRLHATYASPYVAERVHVGGIRVPVLVLLNVYAGFSRI